MKKWLAMLLSIILTVQLAVPVWAADGAAEHETVASTVKSGMCGDNLTWTLNDDGVLAISGTGVIKDSAFDSTGKQPEIKTAIIGDGVTSIGNNAFFNCGGLTSVEIPDSVTSIGSNAFYNCRGLTSVEIPDSVTSIGDSAFQGCSSLASVKIPDGIVTINSYVFSNCSSLTSITIPDSVTSIGQGAFYNCSALTDVYYGGSRAEWNKIRIDAYYNDQLRGATIHYAKTDPTATPTQTPMPTPIATPFPGPTATPAEPSVPTSGACGENLTWKIEYGVLTISCSCSMTFYPPSQSPWAAAKIKSVVIESGVTSIGSHAFSDCSSLTSVEIPNSITFIDQGAFSGCSNLASITIPDGVTTIRSGAFRNCSSLTSITIPDSVTNIGEGVFYHCTGLADDKGFVIVRNMLCGYFGKGADVVVPTGVTKIDIGAFEWCSSLTSVEIPDSVTSIGGSAFQWCSSLTSVKIPDGIVTINSYVFSNCSSLTSITIPDSVTNICPNAFSNCSGLTSVEIPDSVTSIGPSAFYDCSALTDVYYGGSRAGWNKIWIYEYNDQLTGATIHYAKTDPTATPTQTPMPTPIVTPNPTATPATPPVPTSGTCGENLTWKLEDGVLTISGTGAMTDYSPIQGPQLPWAAAKIKSVVIESGVTSIGDFAFAGQVGLTSITIPDSVTSIGDYAFYNCSSLASIAIPDSVTSIGSNIFYGCSSLKSITIPDSVTNIGEGAFCGCAGLADDKGFVIVRNMLCGYFGKGADVAVPTGVAKIDMGAFESCSSLVSIAIPDSVTSIGQRAFYGCSSLKSITIPDSVTSIGQGAFFGCSSLTSITIPDGVTSIENYTFFNCSSLASIAIPDSVTSIGQGTFSGCSSLKSITIPDSVTTICSDAFCNCSSLTSVEIPDSVTSIGDYTFYNCTGLTDVFYSGCSEAKWNSISIQSGNDDLKNAAIHYSDHRWDEGVITKPATRTEEGEKTFTCTVCRTTRTETIPALTPEPDSVDLNEIAKDFDGGSIGVDVDGKTVYPDGEGNYPRLTVPEGTTTLISVSTCNLPEGVDPHTRYPVGMAVYKATNTDGTTSVERISEMDDLLRYAGSSIRITGNKGIRLITGINASLKSALTSEGVAGYTLEEYGTLLCWASEVQNGSLSLSDAYARHNYAYSLANGTDPVFRYAGDVVQYTNVLVGFSNEQCVDDIAMRPYITLRDADGNTYTLYGGLVNRSIGYIAYQNRGAFTPGTNAYNYIWDIIHFVYGDAYDEDYKG